MPTMNRRHFIQAAASVTAAMTLGRTPRLNAQPERTNALHSDSRKLIIVAFGGGTRSSESIDDPAHRFIPDLWNKMVPGGTLFTNMRVEHKVVHPNSTGSMMSGHWEWDDVDWTRPLANPSIFEVFRRRRKASDTSAWAFVYASILSQVGCSLHGDFGSAYAANIVVPPTIPRTTARQMDRIMHQAAGSPAGDVQLDAARQCARLARTNSRLSTDGLRSETARDFIGNQYQLWRSQAAGTSHDAFLADRAIACMNELAPDIILVNFGEIDCAHYGSWSRYVDAIRRTDELTWRLWKATQQHDSYRDNTLMLVLPDHGRQLDRPGCWGFIHHSNFYTGEDADEGCRRVWMLALGPGVKSGLKIDTPTPITTVAATGLEFLDLEPSKDAQRSIWNLIV